MCGPSRTWCIWSGSVITCIKRLMASFLCFFFFQAEDGIRDLIVTGVQTCALPISRAFAGSRVGRQIAAVDRGDALGDIEAEAQAALARAAGAVALEEVGQLARRDEIGRASCRERV